MLLPQLFSLNLLYLNSGPLLIAFAWFGRETLEPLRHFSSFSFTLKNGCQLVYLCLVQFRFESWMSGFLVEEKENFVLQSFLFEERTNPAVLDP